MSEHDGCLLIRKHLEKPVILYHIYGPEAKVFVKM